METMKFEVSIEHIFKYRTVKLQDKSELPAIS